MPSTLRCFSWVLLVVSTACFAGAPADGPECGAAYDKACPDGMVCIDFLCHQICQTSDDCGPAEACMQSYRQPYAQACDDQGDCVDGWYCGGGACHKALPLGEPCTDDHTCSKGSCVDSVCCDAACNGSCEACLSSWTGVPDGVCAPVRLGDDPAMECTGPLACNGARACFDGAVGDACAEDYECSTGECESGRCVAAPNGQGCFDPSDCTSGNCVDGVCCDAPCDGSCEACAVEETGSPTGECAVVLAGRDPDDECPGPLACNGAGQCYAKSLGTSCTDGPTQCVSTFCASEGICCIAACDGICERCSAAGACEAIPDGQDPASECADDQGYGCDGDRACHSGAADGVTCGQDSQCASGHCVDDVCCESDCVGTCRACSHALTGGANGQCEPIPFFTDPDAECSNGVGCNGEALAPACNPPKTWRTPVLIETDNGGDAGSPDVEADEIGNAVAVWGQNDGVRWNIVGNRWSIDSASWGAPILLEHDDDGDVSAPRISMNADGEAIGVWTHFDASNCGSPRANRYVPGIGWATRTVLAQASDKRVRGSPSIGLDDAGNAVAVWNLPVGPGCDPMSISLSDPWASQYVSGVGWGAAGAVATGNLAVANVDVATSRSGVSTAVWWHSGDRSVYSVRARRHTSVGGWANDALVATSDAFHSARNLRVATDATGNAVVVWTATTDATGTIGNVWASSFAAATGWSSAVVVWTSNHGSPDSLDVAADPLGNAIAVWVQSDGTRNNIYANRYELGTGWTWTWLLETYNAGDARNPRVAMDRAGNAIVVWQQSDGTRDDIWAKRYVFGTGWGTGVRLETASGNARNPAVALDGAGNATVVWDQTDGTRYNIWASQYRP